MSGSVRIGAVIPAAGLSSRMGAFKPLLPYEDRTVIEASVGSVLPHVSSAVAVLGYRADELSEALRRFGDRLTTVVNPDYASTDMLHSVQLGLRAMGECEAFFLLPADMPAIPAVVFEALIGAFDGSAEVVCPVTGGRRGHPVLIASTVIPAILSHAGEDGLRGVLRERIFKEVEVPAQGILTDLDTPQDYENLKAKNQ